MKKNYLQFICLVSFYIVSKGSAIAQIPKSFDSLSYYLKARTAIGQAPDTNYIRALAEYAYLLVYEKNDYSRADSIARRSEQFARKLNYGMGVYKSLVAQGAAQFHLNQFEKVITLFRQSAVDVERYHLPRLYQCRALANTASVYRQMNRYKDVIAVTTEALRIESKYHVMPRNEQLRSSMGYAFQQLGKPHQALPYHLEALVIAKENKDLRSQAIIENELGNLYDVLNMPEKAITYFRQTIQHAREGKYDLVEADGLDNLGMMYYTLHQYTKGIPYVRQALALSEKLGFRANIANSNFNLGSLYTELKKYPEAVSYINKALAIVHEDADLKREISFTEALATLDSLQHNYLQAYNYQRRASMLKDSLITAEKEQAMQDMVVRYETEKKEAQIKLLHQQAQLRTTELNRQRFQRNAMLVGAVLVLLLAGAVSAWLLNRARFRRLQEAQLLRKQIAHDLHDEVGSTLSSISLLSGMVNGLLDQTSPVQGSAETAQRMVQKIYTDTRQILEAIDEIIWTINPTNDSIQRIALRLQEYAQPLMASKNIRFSFVIDPALDMAPISMEIRRNLYLIGKEAINNLIKYSHATEATVHFERNNNELSVLITDNGRGFNTQQASERTGQTSMLQRAQAMAGSLTVQSAEGSGTSLKVSVPIG